MLPEMELSHRAVTHLGARAVYCECDFYAKLITPIALCLSA